MSLLVKDEYTDLLSEATPAIRAAHEAKYHEWMPHEWIPWDLGRNFAFLGGKDWEPSDATMDEVSVAATAILNFHKDLLPSYHRILTQKTPGGTELFRFINRWTAEEATHAVPLRDYLVVTRAFDPEELEKRRLNTVWRGYLQAPETFELSTVDSLALVAVTELVSSALAQALSEYTTDVALQKLGEHIAYDDHLQAESFIELLKVALESDFPAVSTIILRVAAAASPIGEDWGEGYPEVTIISEKLYTPERHQEVVNDFLQRVGLLPGLE